MKKYLYSLLFMAMAIVSSVALVSCDSKDPVTEEEKPVAEPTYAKLEIKFSEDIFEYGDFNVTLEYDNQKYTYTLNEKTKTTDVKFDGLEAFKEQNKISGRVLEVAPFQYKNVPVTYTGKFVLSEEGKKKIAAATTKDIDIICYAKLQRCKEDGTVGYISDGKTDIRVFNGTHVNELEGFLQTLEQEHKFLFEQSIE